MALVDYLIQPGEMTTPEAADRKRKMAMLLQQQGTDTSPVDHWTQGAARVVNALSGRLREAKADRDEEFSRKEGAKDEAPLMAALFGGGGGAPATGGVAGALAGPNINTADSEFEGGGHTQKVRTYASIGDNPIAKQAFNFYVSKGLSPHAAAGLVGQFAQESNFNPGIWNKGEGAFGLAQWRGDRLAGLQRYAASVGKNPNDPQVQLEYSWQELNGPEKATLTALQNARDPHSATAAAIGYERPQGWTSQNPVAGHGFGNRLAAATAAASAFGGQQQPTQVAQADIPAPGAQPAEYQIPGQAQPQAQGGGMTPAVALALRTMNNPYASPVAKMAAKAIIERAGAVADPLKQAELEKYNYERSRRGFNEEKDAASLDAARAGTTKTLAEVGQVGKTGEINEYEQARREGYQGTFLDYQKTIAEARRSQVNIDQRAEGAEEKKRGEGMGDRLNSIAAEGGKAQEDAVTFQRFGQLLEGAQTGGKTALLEGIRQLSGGTIVLDPNVDNVQALNAAIQYIAPRLRVPGTGAQSDAELRNFMNSVPTLAGQPGGNKIILDTLQGLIQYKLQRAEIAQAWQSGEISGKEATKQIQSLPSPFANLPKVEEKKAVPGKAPAGVDQKVWDVMTPEEKSLWAN